MFKMDSVLWSVIQGNRFNRKLEPEMLSGEVSYTSNPRIYGSNKYRSSELREIIYNREYVIQFIVKLVIKPLGIKTKKELDQLMIEAWQASKDE